MRPHAPFDPGDVLKRGDTAGEAIDAGYHQVVAGRSNRGSCDATPAFRGRAATLFGADNFAADGTQSRSIGGRAARRRSAVERLA
jgi:hypothetical protein